jgi:ABC-2 type transport system ATP-binding protein
VERELTVDVQNVTRSFGDIKALSDLDLAIPKGAITVLLGPNGAGKTTAIRMITGALAPDAGSAKVFGLDPAGPDGEEVRRRCGVVSAKPSLYDRLSGWDNLRYAAELYGIGRGKEADSRIYDAAEMFAIETSLEHKVGGYSTGMKTRLALARSILHGPDLLLLDEPTSGLDPESALAVLDLIRHMTSDGQTVLMCTHLLLEAEGLADEIVVMQAGTSLKAGRPADLTKDYWPTQQVKISSTMPEALDALVRDENVLEYAREGDSAILDMESHSSIPSIVASLSARNVPITSVVPMSPSLEDLYFAIRREHGSVEGELEPPGGSSGRPVRIDTSAASSSIAA